MILGLIIFGIIFIIISIIYYILHENACKSLPEAKKPAPGTFTLIPEDTLIKLDCQLKNSYMVGITIFAGVLGLIFTVLGIFLRNGKDIYVSSENTATQGGSRRSRR